jgi:pilus assembly protein CpaB
MRGRTVILFLIALLLAGGTATLVRSWLAQRPTVATVPPAPPPAPQKSVLVAGAAITRGQILKPDDLVWRPWPDSAIPSGFIVSGAQPEKSFAGWVAREPFVAGEPIVKAKIIAPGDHGFLAAVLKPGMRAVSITVDQISDVSGFIVPDDRVDIVINLSLPAESGNGSGYQRKAAETVLRDIRVVAIDQRLDSKDGQAVLARTVTLEVTPKESEIVALAADMGKLSLSLRSLVATPYDKPTVLSYDKPAVLSVADSTAGAAPDPPADSIDGHGSVSFTLDSEVSPLVPKPFVFNHNYSDGRVTILRGNANSGTSGGSQSGS